MYPLVLGPSGAHGTPLSRCCRRVRLPEVWEWATESGTASASIDSGSFCMRYTDWVYKKEYAVGMGGEGRFGATTTNFKPRKSTRVSFGGAWHKTRSRLDQLLQEPRRDGWKKTDTHLPKKLSNT